MRKIILLLTILLGIALVGCQKDDVKQAVTGPVTPTTSGGGITTEEKYVFTQDEVNYFNSLLGKALAQVKDSSVKEKNIDRNNL